MGLGSIGASPENSKGDLLLNSVQAVFKKIETVAVSIHLDAFELLDCDADAKALHGECFGPWYASLLWKVTPVF